MLRNTFAWGNTCLIPYYCIGIATSKCIYGKKNNNYSISEKLKSKQVTIIFYYRQFATFQCTDPWWFKFHMCIRVSCKEFIQRKAYQGYIERGENRIEYKSEICKCIRKVGRKWHTDYKLYINKEMFLIIYCTLTHFEKETTINHFMTVIIYSNYTFQSWGFMLHVLL